MFVHLFIHLLEEKMTIFMQSARCKAELIIQVELTEQKSFYSTLIPQVLLYLFIYLLHNI